MSTLDSGINVGVCLLILLLFSSGYVLIKGIRLSTFLSFLVYEIQIICYFKGGLCLFKGLCLLFLPNVPGDTFIQGGMSIPEPRVHIKFP